LVIVGVFVAMKARIAWYATTQWPLADDMKAISGTIGLIDGYAFWLSVVVGIAGCAYISRCRTPVAVHPSYRTQIHRFVLLCAAATCALAVSVISDGVLTALRLSGAGCPSPSWSPSFRWRSKSLVRVFLFFTFAASRGEWRPQRSHWELEQISRRIGAVWRLIDLRHPCRTPAKEGLIFEFG
jgi:hypothetical protein